MKKARRALPLILVLACLASLVLIYAARSTPAPPSLDRVAAWMPSAWDAARARASWEANRALVHELSPVWYQLAAVGDGSVVAYAGARDAALVEQAHAGGTLVLPLVNNHYEATGFDAAVVSLVIHDPARRAAHVAALVDEVLATGSDGVDLDYESLGGEADREGFSLLVEELAAALHARGRLLAVDVHPKTFEPGSWDGPQAQDWRRIGAAADRVRLMTYAYHHAGGEPGPIAPLWWAEDVVRFATSCIPPDKVTLGLHLYGHDWGGGTATSLTWESVQQLLAATGAESRWQARADWRQEVAEPWFTYTDAAGQAHEVWYADGWSVAARLGLVDRYGLGGVVLWRLGGEDPAAWDAIERALQAGE